MQSSDFRNLWNRCGKKTSFTGGFWWNKNTLKTEIVDGQVVTSQGPGQFLFVAITIQVGRWSRTWYQWPHTRNHSIWPVFVVFAKKNSTFSQWLIGDSAWWFPRNSLTNIWWREIFVEHRQVLCLNLPTLLPPLLSLLQWFQAPAFTSHCCSARGLVCK